MFLVSAALLFMLSPAETFPQDDPNDLPLGDVARNLRKKTVKPVIDDDNFAEVMQKSEEGRGFGSGLKFLMTGESKGFQLAAPDVTCSLSFTANVKSLLSGQYSQMALPAAELAKLQSQATIEGDALTVPVFNGTDWHLSELAVALTVVRKVSEMDTDPLAQVRAEKKPDTTVMYRMRAAALPWERAVFSAPLNIDLAPGEEWHWAIIEAKGYPPETYTVQQSADTTKPGPNSIPIPVSLTDPENPLAVTPQLPRP